MLPVLMIVPRFCRERWAKKRGNPGAEMSIFKFCLFSQSIAGLLCYVVAMEKNTASCAIKWSRKRHFQEFFRVDKTDGKLQNS